MRSPWVVAVIGLALMVTVGSTLILPISNPGTGSVGEMPFTEDWPFWRLFLHPLEPGIAELRTHLCDGSSMIRMPGS